MLPTAYAAHQCLYNTYTRWASTNGFTAIGEREFRAECLQPPKAVCNTIPRAGVNSTRETAKSHPGARSIRASSSRKVQRDA